MAVISIEYNEGAKKLNYKAVRLHYAKLKKKEVFKSGNFVKDWFNAIKFIIKGNLGEPISSSSSVDHFITDGAPYDSVYLHTDDNTELRYEYDEEGIELFVDKGTKPTWEELKKYVK